MKKILFLFTMLVLLCTPAALKAQQTLTVYDGTETTNGYVPLYGFYADAYLKAEFVYPASELTAMAGGTINSVTFYASQSSVSWGAADFQVFVSEVTDESISSFYGPGTVVYEGSLSIIGNEMTVTFTTPYVYQGGNLLIGVYEPTTGSYVTSSWYGETVSNASVQGYSYSSLGDVTPTQRNFLPKTKFNYTPSLTPMPANLTATNVTTTTATLTWNTLSSDVVDYQFRYQPEGGAWTAWTTTTSTSVVLNSLTPETNYTFEVQANYGSNGYSYTASTVFQTESLCPFPTDLTVSGNGIASWTDNSTATAWQICLDGDETNPIDAPTNPYTLTGLTEGVDYNVKVRAVCDASLTSAWSDEVTFTFGVIGSGSGTSSYLPTYTYYKNSLTEQIYTAAEVGEAGTITSISFYNTDYDQTRNLDLYLLHTDRTAFSGSYDWENVTSSDLVYSGDVTFAAGDWTTITLDSPFEYDGTHNLLVVVDDNTGSYEYPYTQFLVFDATSQAISVYDDSENYDPTNAAGYYYGTVLNVKNQIQLNITPNTPIVVDATVEIGDGTSTTYQVPYNSLYVYSFTEQIFPASEIGTAGIINSISFDLGQSYTSEQTNDIVLYMKNVTRETFTSTTDYEPVTAADIVFNGQWTIPSNYTGWVTITLDTPFEYDGTSNLFIAMDENTSDWSSRYFTYTSVSNSGLCYYSDSYNPDPYDLDSYSGSKTLRSNRSNIQLGMTVVITPGSCPKPTDVAVTELGEVSWTENGSATTWQICLDGDETNPIEVTTNPYTLAGLTDGTSYSVKVRAICSSYELSSWSSSVTFTYHATPTSEIEIGDGTGTTYYGPYNSLWGYSFVEQIYPASEIGQAGSITAISFNMSSTDAQTNQVDVFMKNVSRSEFSSNTDWEEVTAADMVFSGTVTFNSGWTTITLDTPFEYDGLSNLMIGMHEYTSGYSTRYFYYTAATNSLISGHSDSYNPNPYDMASYSGTTYVQNYRNNIRLTMTQPAPSELTVADGTSTNGYVPVYGFYCDAYLKAEVVYPAADLHDMAGGTINGMTFYSSNTNVSWGSADFQVFLTEVPNTSISSFAGPGTVVYEGPLSIENGLMTVNFTTPYAYGGGNLLLGVYNTVTGDYESCSWYGQTVSGASVQGYSYSDLSSITPSQRNFIPKTTFSYISPLCARPENLAVVTGSVTAHEATVQWDGPASAYNLRYRDPSAPASSATTATIILTVGDVWGDGSGYQMLLDADANTYGTIIPTSGGLTTSGNAPDGLYDEFEYKIPANADGDLNTTNIVFENTVTLEIPAGTYDWCITNPTPGDRLWIASATGNISGRQDDFVFEAGGTYEFVVSHNDATGNDAVNLTYTPDPNDPWTYVYNVTSPYQITGLNGETTYNWEVLSVCNATTSSAWSETSSFTTDVSCHTPELTASYVQPTTALLTWTNNGEASAWQLCIDGDESNLIDVTEDHYTVTDLDRETSHTAKIRANCAEEGLSYWSDEITFQFGYIGDADVTTDEQLPSNSYYYFGMSEQIYTAAEVGNQGYITSISFFNEGDTRTRNYDMYLVTTTMDTFASDDDWVNVTSADLVFSGSIDMVEGDWTTFTLNAPFEYDGTSNLLLVMDDNTDDYESGMQCRVFNAPGQALSIVDDNENFDPQNANGVYSGVVMNVKNQIKFQIIKITDVNDSVCTGSWYAQHGFLLDNDTIDNYGPDFTTMLMSPLGYDSVINLHIYSRNCPCGEDITDIDGNIYSTIGVEATGVKQCWITSNLRTTHYADATEIDPEPIVYSYPYNAEDLTNLDTYGRLYTFAAVTNGETGDSIQGVCPTGWRVPTQSDFEVLINNFSLSQLRSQMNWISGNGNNASEFNMQPGGYYSAATGACERLHGCACFYTANFTAGQGAMHLYSFCGCDDILFEYGNVQNAYSVRCVKNF